MNLRLHFLGGLLGVLGGGLLTDIFGNATNKSNQQAQTNSQNNAEQFQLQQLQAAINFIKSQQAGAFTNLQNYVKNNPNPALSAPPIVGPNNTAPATLGGQQFGPNGMETNPGASGMPTGSPDPSGALLSALQALKARQSLAAMIQPPPRTAGPGAPEPRMAAPLDTFYRNRILAQ